jgi:hypothetical protein
MQTQVEALYMLCILYNSYSIWFQQVNKSKSLIICELTKHEVFQSFKFTCLRNNFDNEINFTTILFDEDAIHNFYKTLMSLEK